MASAEDLEARIQKLEEKKSVRELVVSNLFGPILVAVVAATGALYVQHLQTRAEAHLDVTAKQIERMRLAQAMVADLFGDNHSRALATEAILTRVLDDAELVKSIRELVASYYEEKLRQQIDAGNLRQASLIVDSAKQVDSPTAQAIVKKAESEHKADIARGRKLTSAALFEAKGFAALEAGNFDEAKKSFTRAAEIAPDYHSVRQISQKLAEAGERPAPKEQQSVTQEIRSKYSLTPPVTSPQETREPANMMEQRPLRSSVP